MMFHFLFSGLILSALRRRMNSGRRFQRGIGLVETLITMALLGMVLSLAGQIAVSGFRYSRQSLEGQQCWRDAATANDRLARELRHCEAIIWPVYSDWQDGREITAAKGKNLLLACKFRSSKQSKGVVVGYRYLGAKGVLERCVYPASYKFSSASLTSNAGMSSRQTLLTGVTGFSFWSVPASKCCGLSMLGLSFTVMPIPQNKSYSRAYAQCGLSLCTEVQTGGL